MAELPERLIVVGAGAAGYFGAIAAAAAHPHLQVTLLEAAPEPLGKVRISGGGRCNVTHHCFDPAQLVQHYPRGGKALRGAFSRFQPRDTVAWFAQRGVALKTEPDGRMFPTTDDSATIVDCLMAEGERLGVTLWCRAAVLGVVAAPAGGFRVTVRSGQGTPQVLTCDRLLLATGSSPQGHRLAVALGHTLLPPVPSLFTFNIGDPALRALAGVAVDPAQVSLTCGEGKPLVQRGPLLITHWGLSGPAVLKLSAWGARLLHDHRYQGQVRVNWLPDWSGEQVRDRLQAQRQENPKRAIASHCPVPLPRRLWRYLVDRSPQPPDTPWNTLSKATLQFLTQHLTQCPYPLQGRGVFKEEFVTCGGINLKEVDFKTLQSRRCPGLFFAGEILDIDGVTGGFNFQSAWTTSWLAAQAIGRS